ncbi:YidH family protein [Mariniblastus fucicola]|uniref:DUF202 domain-containing protein n=1 Tax=Mariniblastus fucicola TaxID=980251 RepID=A0A5B9PAC5_9BACT|nr:DUF202 domain-containing protein [Mariniblastus fucicola]QEG23727.1 hypothetical protein MFFC18_36290 [Mariniblastus fucicola]
MAAENQDNDGGKSKRILEDDPRVQMAAERTVLAWIRTGLALMAFGFVIARFALVMQSLGVNTSVLLIVKATVIGVLLVCLGVVTTAAAPYHYHKYFRRIGQSDNRFAASTLVVFVSYGAALVGVALAMYLLFIDFSSLGIELNAEGPPGK